jgi:hypothetical protein
MNIIKLTELYKQIINEYGDLQNIEPYSFTKTTNKYTFFSDEIEVNVSVEFDNVKSLEVKLDTVSKIYYDNMKKDDVSYNVSFEIEGIQSQFTKTNLSVYNRIMKTIVIIIQDFINIKKPYGLWIFGTNKKGLSMSDAQKNIIYYNISKYYMPSMYRISEAIAKYNGALYDGYVIFQDRKSK